MSDAKHTAGPWVVDETYRQSGAHYSWKIDTAGNHFLLANRIYPDDENDLAELEANAHLIAASPDLRAALVGLADAYVALLLMKAEDPSRFKEPGSPYANALAAIAKAEGK